MKKLNLSALANNANNSNNEANNSNNEVNINISSEKNVNAVNLLKEDKISPKVEDSLIENKPKKKIVSLKAI